MTIEDIQLYIGDKLTCNPRMRTLALQNPKGVKVLLQEVSSKAEGVFLWVTIVVKSLLNGLKDRNDLSILKERLRLLPSELKNLYKHMLDSVDPINLREGSKIFQLQCANAPLGNLLVELLSFALTVDLQQVLGTSTSDSDIPPPDLFYSRIEADGDSPGPDPGYNPNSLCESIDIKLRTHCGGLLQIKSLPTLSGRSINSINFIHRTAREYIEQPDVWKRLLSQSKSRFPSIFDPYLALLVCHVSVFKRYLPYYPYHFENTGACWYAVGCFAREVDPVYHTTMFRLLEEFDSAATAAHSSMKQAQVDLDRYRLTLDKRWSAILYPPSWNTTFLEFASFEVSILTSRRRS
jgi:hypothetical protein